MQNKEKIKKLVIEMLNESLTDINKKLDHVLNSGAIDVEGWNENNAPMITPKTILAALLENEALQYYAKGTSFETRVKKEIKNIKLFI
jgi:hypothetical protein